MMRMRIKTVSVEVVKRNTILRHDLVTKATVVIMVLIVLLEMRVEEEREMSKVGICDELIKDA